MAGDFYQRSTWDLSVNAFGTLQKSNSTIPFKQKKGKRLRLKKVCIIIFFVYTSISFNKALVIASIAHPDFRGAFLRDIYEDPFFTKPVDYALDKTPYGVTMYKGSTKIDN